MRAMPCSPVYLAETLRLSEGEPNTGAIAGDGLGCDGGCHWPLNVSMALMTEAAIMAQPSGWVNMTFM